MIHKYVHLHLRLIISFDNLGFEEKWILRSKGHVMLLIAEQTSWLADNGIYRGAEEAIPPKKLEAR